MIREFDKMKDAGAVYARTFGDREPGRYDLFVGFHESSSALRLPLPENEVVDADVGDNLCAGAGVGLRVDRHHRNSGCRRLTDDRHDAFRIARADEDHVEALGDEILHD
jgi:hypothetical protein